MARNKAQRVSAKLFGDVPKFQPKKGMFSPLPWCLRRAQPLFTPRAWQVYTYLVMRSGPEAMVWASDKQIAHDIGVTWRKIRPQLKAIVRLGLIVEGEHEGLRYLCLVDPVHALTEFAKSEGITKDERAALEAVDDDLDLIGTGLSLFGTKEAGPVAEEPAA